MTLLKGLVRAVRGSTGGRCFEGSGCGKSPTRPTRSLETYEKITECENGDRHG